MAEPATLSIDRLKSALTDAIIAAWIAFTLFCLTLGVRTVELLDYPDGDLDGYGKGAGSPLLVKFAYSTQPHRKTASGAAPSTK